VDKDRSAFIHVPPLQKPWGAEDLATAICICITEMLRQLEERDSQRPSSSVVDLSQTTQFEEHHLRSQVAGLSPNSRNEHQGTAL